MKVIHTPCAVREDYITVQVIFNNVSGQSKPYTYLAPLDSDLETGDLVVVPTVHGVKIATVWMVDEDANIDFCAAYRYDWIYHKVDKAEHDRNVAIDDKIIEAAKMREMQIRRQQARELICESLGDDFLSMTKKMLKPTKQRRK